MNAEMSMTHPDKMTLALRRRVNDWTYTQADRDTLVHSRVLVEGGTDVEGTKKYIDSRSTMSIINHATENLDAGMVASTTSVVKLDNSTKDP